MHTLRLWTVVLPSSGGTALIQRCHGVTDRLLLRGRSLGHTCGAPRTPQVKVRENFFGLGPEMEEPQARLEKFINKRLKGNLVLSARMKCIQPTCHDAVVPPLWLGAVLYLPLSFCFGASAEARWHTARYVARLRCCPTPCYSGATGRATA